MPTKTGRIRAVAIVTGTRAEYGLLKPVAVALGRARLRATFVACGMHLSEQFGHTIDQIESDGFRIADRVDMLFDSDRTASMGKSVGIGIVGLCQTLERLDVEAVVVLGDRTEAFAGAVAGAFAGKVVAHVHGGDVTRGGFDESMRHAITRFAHLHFAATERSYRRLLKMGERPETVFKSGAPGVDAVREAAVQSRSRICDRYALDSAKPFLLVLQHPVSTDGLAAHTPIDETIEGVAASGLQALWIYPNSDAGSRRLLRRLRETDLRTVASVSSADYLSLLRHAAALVGNSSSALIEAPAFGTPAVNIGSRQQGRDRGANVIDVPNDRRAIAAAIRKAVTPTFRARIARAGNPYGDGHASRRIATVLARTSITPALLQKHLSY